MTALTGWAEADALTITPSWPVYERARRILSDMRPGPEALEVAHALSAYWKQREIARITESGTAWEMAAKAAGHLAAVVRDQCGDGAAEYVRNGGEQ